MDNDLARWERALLQRAPTFTLAVDYPPSSDIPRHVHGVGQVLHTISGVLLAETPGRAWAIPPGRALWLPKGTVHQFKTAGATSLRTLYVADEAAHSLPATPHAMRISSLVRELIVHAGTDGQNGTSARVQSLLMPLLLAELPGALSKEFSMPMPTGAGLLAFTRKATARPSIRTSKLAAELGMSEKTLVRRFIKETGITPDQWRRHACLLATLAQLQTGQSVTEVAHAAGYGSSASFAAAFKAFFGMTPTRSRA